MKPIATLFLAVSLFAQNRPVAVPDNVVFERDIDYANILGGKLQMDVARPKGDGPFPGVVMIHGGGFRGGQRQSYHALAIKLAESGFVAATITYRLTPKFQFPSPVFDAKSAVRFLRANAARFHLDAAKMGTMGGSAGGHLALMLGLTGGVPEMEGDGPNPEQSSRVQCVVNYYGPTDFTRIYDKGGDAADVLPQFLGGAAKWTMAAHIKASPLNWVSPDDPPVLTIHGTKDPLVPYEQGVWLTGRLQSSGVETELMTMSGAGHGFRGKDGEEAQRRTIEFFKTHLMRPLSAKRIIAANHGRGGGLLAIDWPSGKVLWTHPNDSGHDVQVLPNGHILFTRDSKGIVTEIDENRKEVWNFTEGIKRPTSAQRLENGNTLIGDSLLGKAIEVTAQGKVVWQYANPEMGEGRLREVRRTPQGTNLIAIEVLGKILEVDAAGKIVWTYTVDAKRRPYLAQRLANGNTVISHTEPGEVIEVDRNGKTVRSIGADSKVRMGWASGVKMMPDGSMFISDYSGKRLLEVNAKGELVAEHRSNTWAIASIDVLP
ncbi:MAG: alpha/beta hydrolase fold domain-containing protein [Candidatus Solibacter usitatus]|nr:alpha/beta hydrolase fold domain-containing protein [Candidatus Solibacter usitatus]